MKYAELKSEIKEIAELCESLPEQFREICFEVLLSHLISPVQPATSAGSTSEVPDSSGSDSNLDDPSPISVPAGVKAFMRRTSISSDDLEKVIYIQDGEIHFVAEPHTKTVTRGQVEWAMLLALKNAFEGKGFEVDPEDLRSICQEKGYYDRTNFWKAFKSSKNKKLLSGELEPQGHARRLTADGQDELAAVLRALAG